MAHSLGTVLVARLAEDIDRLGSERRVLLSIDGPDAAGKTSLADELARYVNRPALRVSMDDWHNPREVRLRRGAESPDGYYLDSFDYAALLSECVTPFNSGASRVRTVGFDYQAEQEVEAERVVATNAVLLLDGVFLLRPELRGLWDLSIYLHVPESVTLARALQRDLTRFGGEENVRHRYERRYLPGQSLYREQAAPLTNADIVLDNSNPLAPVILRWRVRE